MVAPGFSAPFRAACRAGSAQPALQAKRRSASGFLRIKGDVVAFGVVEAHGLIAAGAVEGRPVPVHTAPISVGAVDDLRAGSPQATAPSGRSDRWPPGPRPAGCL